MSYDITARRCAQCQIARAQIPEARCDFHAPHGRSLRELRDAAIAVGPIGPPCKALMGYAPERHVVQP